MVVSHLLKGGGVGKYTRQAKKLSIIRGLTKERLRSYEQGITC